MDDIWLTSDSITEVSLGMDEIRNLMRSMNIEVHKWGSNCPELLEGIPPDKRAKVVKLTDPDREAIKALGLTWDSEKDVFLFPKGTAGFEPLEFAIHDQCCCQDI